MIKKIFKIVALLILSLVILIVIWWFWPERTPQIKIKGNKTSSVSSIEYIELGGTEQCVLTRSENTNNPILLFLHGGPGMPMMYLSYEFQRPLEKKFTVVQWDRRGAGKSFSRNEPSVESMNVRQLINDAYELIDILKKKYKQDKVILIGHSFGTYLGSIMVSERPDLFSGYISIGQVVDNEKSTTLQLEFIKEQAKKRGRKDILSALDNPIQPNLENWLFEFGGELKNSKSYLPLIWSGMKAPEYTLKDVLDVAKGSSFSSSNMKYNVLENSIYYEIREYKVPVYFFVGKYDYTTPATLIEEYYNLIKAPKKDVFYFKNSAHFPFYEEPEVFVKKIDSLFGN